MSILRFLFVWGNAPYTIVGGISVGFTLISQTGLLGLFAGEADHDGGDTDGGDTDGGDTAGDGSHSAGAAHESDGLGLATPVTGRDNEALEGSRKLPTGKTSARRPKSSFAALPLSIRVLGSGVIFAATGLALHSRYLATGQVPVAAWLWSIPLSTIVTGVAMLIVAKALAPVFAEKYGHASRRIDLVGLSGEVTSSQVSASFGEVRVMDPSGHELFLIVKLHESAPRVPTTGQTVVVVEAKDDELFVSPV